MIVDYLSVTVFSVWKCLVITHLFTTGLSLYISCGIYVPYNAVEQRLPIYQCVCVCVYFHEIVAY